MPHDPPIPRDRLRTTVTLVALLSILALAAYVRLSNLAENPGWFSDEGSNLEVASHLLQGKLQYMALGQSTLLVSRLILFEGLLAASLAVFGHDLVTLRVLTGLLGVASVLTLYGCVRRLTRKRTLALLAALLLAIYPQAIVYSRFGFSYNLLPILLLPATLGLYEYTQTGRRRWLLLAAVLIGLGTLSDLWMLALLAPLGAVVLLRRWRDSLWSLPLAALPFGLYLAFLWSRAPQAVTTDLSFVFFRVSDGSLPGQIQSVAMNYTVLLSQDFWMPCAVIGFLLLRPLALRHVTLAMFFLPLVAVGRTAALYNLSAHYLIPLLPLVAFGAAVLVETGLAYLWRYAHEALPSIRLPIVRMRWSPILGAGLCLSLVALPFLVALSLDLDHVRSGFPTSIDPFLISPADARQVVQFIDTHAQPDDLVIASAVLGWRLTTRTADIQMSVAAAGQATFHYPGNIPPDRWLFDPGIDRARFVVLDGLWRSWGTTAPGELAAVIRRVRGWPPVLQTGSLTVYQNPLAARADQPAREQRPRFLSLSDNLRG